MRYLVDNTISRVSVWNKDKDLGGVFNYSKYVTDWFFFVILFFVAVNLKVYANNYSVSVNCYVPVVVMKHIIVR